MAEYITYSEYSSTKGVDALPEAQFEELSLIAKDIVDGYTFSVIENRNLSDDSHYRPRIVRAMALIIDALSRADLTEYLAGGSDNISSKSESIGGYSYSVSFKSEDSSVFGISVPPLAKILLMPIKALGRTR